MNGQTHEWVATDRCTSILEVLVRNEVSWSRVDILVLGPSECMVERKGGVNVVGQKETLVLFYLYLRLAH
jgi:hypothetical protein